MKKITSLIITLMMMATMVVVPLQASAEVDETGNTATTGTAADPILISTAEELLYFAGKTNTTETVPESDPAIAYSAASYKLTADIPMGDAEWTPIGWSYPTWDSANSMRVDTPAFTGTFDGNGKKVSNLKIDITDNSSIMAENLGFFGYTNGATIKDLGLDNIKIKFKNHDYEYVSGEKQRTYYTGAMVGRADNTTISGCYVTNSTVANTNKRTNDDMLAGFVGKLVGTTNISNSYVYKTIISGGQLSRQSGFAGRIENGSVSISNCYAAEVKNGSYLSSEEDKVSTTYGFAFSKSNPNISNCYSTMPDVQGTYHDDYGYAELYVSGYSKGVSGVTKEELVERMTATGVYEVTSEDIQGGYPVLKKTEVDMTPVSVTPTNGVYVVRTAGELAWVRNKVNANEVASDRSINIQLAANIDLGGNEWTPIGLDGNGNEYAGAFDGKGFVIKNFKVTEGTRIALFGQATGTIKNLGVEDATYSTTTTGSVSMGGLVARGHGTFENCYVKNISINASPSNDDRYKFKVGGFAGIVRNNATFKNCYVYNVTFSGDGAERTGGFAGQIENGNAGTTYNFENCFVAGITENITRSYLQFIEKKESSEVYNFTGVNAVENSPASYNAKKEVFYNASTGNNEIVVGDKNAILTAYANHSIYQINAAINNGYPSFMTEKVAVEKDFIITSVTKAVNQHNSTAGSGYEMTNDDRLVVKVRNNKGGSAKVYVTSYDSYGRLMDVKTTALGADETVFSTDLNYTGAAYIKVFVWDSDVKPVAKQYIAVPTMETLKDSHILTLTTTDTTDYNAPPTALENLYPSPQAENTSLFVIADSLADDVVNNDGGYTTTDMTVKVTKRGWTGFIEDYLDENVSVVSHAHSGGNIQMYMEGRKLGNKSGFGAHDENGMCSWEFTKDQIKSGDYVVISLGTNDEGALSGSRFYDNDGTFTGATNGLNWARLDFGSDGVLGGVDEAADKQYNEDYFVEKYSEIIDYALEIGAKVILTTPPAVSTSLSGDKASFVMPETQFKNSRAAIKAVADKYGITLNSQGVGLSNKGTHAGNVALVDISNTFITALNNYAAVKIQLPTEMVATSIPNQSNKYTIGTIYVDWCHFTAEGANLLAHTIAKGMIASGIGL